MRLSAPPLLLLGVALAACGAPAGNRPAQSAPLYGTSTFDSTGAPNASPGPSAGETALAAPGAAPAPNASAPATAPTTPERHGPSLPELSVKSFGLHVGGGAHDTTAHDGFLRALEGASGRYLDCYRLIAEPGSVGTFGADLTVGGAGGKARVGKPRTRLRGESFEACMVRAFESVSFSAPPSGRAVVVSYSVKFSFGE